MLRFPRLSLLLALLLVGLLVPVGAVSATHKPRLVEMPAPTKTYIGHLGRLTLDIPASWQPNTLGAYIGPDGGVFDAPVPGEDLTLDQACSQESANGSYGSSPRTETAALGGQRACVIFPSTDQPDWAIGLMGAVVHHPEPFESFGEPVDYVVIDVDKVHFESITSTLDFDLSTITAKDYFTSAFDLIQAMSIKRDAVDWKSVRAGAMEKLGTTGSLADAYPGINYVLRQLQAAGDFHSFFMTPEENEQFEDNQAAGFGIALQDDVIILIAPGSPADHAGLQVGDVVQAINGEIIWENSYYTQEPKESLFRIQRPDVADPIEMTIKPEVFNTYLAPEGHRLDNIGYIELFGVTGSEETFMRYATTAQQVTAGIDKTPTCGWVIDLRRNQGGAYFPMVAGVGSILGEGTFWGNQTADGETFMAEYRDGHIYDAGYDYFGQLVEGPLYELKEPNPPVAVLMGPSTVSSGEVTLLAFVGRNNTRLFGENSGGFTTSNSALELIDGAELELATTIMTDRTGKPYPSGVIPDEYVATDWSTYGSDDDPVLKAAIDWLIGHPNCPGGPIFPDRDPPRS